MVLLLWFNLCPDNTVNFPLNPKHVHFVQLSNSQNFAESRESKKLKNKPKKKCLELKTNKQKTYKDRQHDLTRLTSKVLSFSLSSVGVLYWLFLSTEQVRPNILGFSESQISC